MKHQDALAQLARETARARKSLALERSLRAGFWLLFALAVWATIALSGLHGFLPLLLQSLSALGALCVFGWLGWGARRAWRPPTEAEARARLAADSRLDAAAFESLRDQPTRYDEFSVALWKREQDDACARVEQAHARGARIEFNDIDPRRLRYVVLAALVLAAVVANDNAGDRLARAFLPDPGPLLGDQEMAIEAWAAPADYTHAAPISLSDRVGERVATPPSIEATVRVTGPTGAPRLVFEGGGQRRSAHFTRAADGAWEAHLAIPGPGRLKIVRFHTRASWRLTPAPDAAPNAAFVSPIATLSDEKVSLQWRARDDYGVSRVVLRVWPVNPPAGLRHASPIDTPIESPVGDPAEAEGESELDLAAHPYAGMEVDARIVAIDALGQVGGSEPLRVTLPEKIFLQRIARAAIEIRRHLLTDRRAYRPARRQARRTTPAGDIVLGSQRIEIRDYTRRPALQRAPEGVRHAARLLEALTMEPQDRYFRDLAVFLGLRLARSELSTAQNIDETEIAADILWRTALRAEYGSAADARSALEAAQRALAEALANGAPQERIRQLMDALRRATDNYLQALVQEAIRNGETPQNQEDTQEQTTLSERDIEDLLNQVQRLSEQGRTQEAQALLQMLANLLNNLDAQLAEGGEGQEGERSEEMQQSMDELSEAIGEQRALNDETRQEQQEQQQSGQGGGGNQQGGAGGEELAERQAEIREGLADAKRQADEAGAAPSDDLDAAGQAMRQAENALRRGDLEDAAAAQTAALDRLREGAEQLAAEMRNRGREGARTGETGPRDPLGRLSPSGGAGEGETQVPTTMDPVRAREIFDEIRRRAQDPNRPEAEREYLRRLMDRFGGDS